MFGDVSCFGPPVQLQALMWVLTAPRERRVTASSGWWVEYPISRRG
jgi:hypothetical protein